MKIITEDHGGNWWHNIRVWGGQELIVPDELGQALIDRGLARIAKEVEKKPEKPAAKPQSKGE